MPKSHVHLVIVPVDISVKCTNSGLQPDVVSALNRAFTCAFSGKPNRVNPSNKKKLFLFFTTIIVFLPFLKYYLPLVG